MKNSNVETGSVVLSIAGRDSGRYFIVTEIQEPYVYLVDGRLHCLTKPKKKKMKHIKPTYDKLDALAEKLIQGKQIFDSEIKKALRVYNEKQED